MKLVFSLKDKIRGYGVSLFNQVGVFARLVSLPLLLYVVTLAIVVSGYFITLRKIGDQEEFSYQCQLLQTRFSRVREVASLEKAFKHTYCSFNESEKQSYLKDLFSSYSPLSDHTKTLHHLLGQETFMYLESLHAQVKALEHGKRIEFNKSVSKTKRKKGFLEREFKLAEAVSLQEAALYHLIQTLEEGGTNGAPQIGIKQLIFSVQDNNLLTIQSMKLFQREFINHEK